MHGDGAIVANPSQPVEDCREVNAAGFRDFTDVERNRATAPCLQRD